MRVLYLCIFTIFFISCKNDEPRVLTPQQKKDIVEVANCIIDETIVKYLDETNDRKPFFCIDLKVLSIIPRPPKDVNGLSEPPPIGLVSVYMDHLLRDNSFLKDNDSFYIREQYYKLDFVTINLSQTEQLNFESKKAIFEKKACNHDTYDFLQSYYYMSAPLFSKDHNKAYIELEYHCGSLCGHGVEYYLSKINGQWQIVNARRTWIS
jgi:hypothetical protein